MEVMVSSDATRFSKVPRPTPSFWRDKRVLLTGHTGFKGAWISLWLNQLGAQVRGLALKPSTSPNLYSLAEIQSCLESCTVDVRDLAAVRAQMSQFKPDVVIHMAAQALVRPSYRDPVETFATNVMGTVHVLEAARACPTARAIVNVTSDKCYENREHAQPYSEDDAMGGHDPYSASKGCAELVSSAYRRSFFTASGVGLATARAGNVLGGGDWSEDRLVPDCIRALQRGQPIVIRNPSSVRPWQHVLEPIAAYLILAEMLFNQPEVFSRAFNFGPVASDERSVGDIADRIKEIWVSRLVQRGDTRQNVDLAGAPHEASILKLNCELARNLMGWRPTLKLEEALRWTVDWHKRCDNGESARALCLEQITAFEELL